MASGSYSEYTQGQFCTDLALRLYDSTEQFWSRAEKRLYIAEALRWWNSLTGYWRGEFIFNSQANVHWYDMTDTAVMPNTNRAMTLRDTDLYALIQYVLLEPQGINPWIGSSQFSTQDLLSSFQRRRDEILSMTGCTLTRHTVGAAAGRTLIPEAIIDVRRMAYLPASIASPNVMWSSDVWTQESYDFNYLQAPPGSPQAYLMVTQPQLSFDVDVPPAFAGNYELITVDAGGVAAVGAPIPLLIPDDFLWVIKYGVLSDLFNRESNAKDALRAKHCEQMYGLGLAVLEQAPGILQALLQVTLANVPIPIDSVRSEDLYNPSWQAAAAAQPTRVLSGGLNLIALSPKPNTSAYQLTLSTVRNAPIPADDTAFIQLGHDEVDVLMDLCVYLSMTKVGGSEFMDTVPLLERFLRAAAVYNSKLAQSANYVRVLKGLSQRELTQNPRMEPTEETADVQ